MNPYFKIIIVIAVFGMILMTISFVLLFYLKRHHLPVVDKAVIGREIPKNIDSIFYVLLRVTNYGGGFSCNWCAKRSKLTDKISTFDNKFKKPFKIYFWCLMLGTVVFFSAVILQHIYFPNVSDVFKK